MLGAPSTVTVKNVPRTVRCLPAGRSLRLRTSALRSTVTILSQLRGLTTAPAVGAVAALVPGGVGIAPSVETAGHVVGLILSRVTSKGADHTQISFFLLTVPACVLDVPVSPCP